MVISTRVSPHDPSCYVLVHGQRPIGWLRMGALGFCGFADRAEARRSARAATAALCLWYRERWRTTVPLPWLTAVAAGEHVEAEGVIVGRLLARHAAPEEDVESAAFELRVPEVLWVATALGLAQRLWLAMREEGALPTAGAVQPR